MKYSAPIVSLLKDYFRSAFVRNFLIVASGTATAQMITFAASPIISRLFTPEDFGGLAIYTTLTALLVTVSCLGYESAIVLPRHDHEAADVTVLSSFLAFIFFLASGVSIVLGGKVFWEYLNINHNDQAYFYFIPLVVLANALASIFVYWNNRKITYKINSAYKVVLSIGTAVLSIVLGFLFEFSNGLIFAFIITHTIASFLFVMMSVRRSSLRKYVYGVPGLVDAAKKHSEFPRYYLIQNFFDSFRENLFVVIINTFFSVGVLGSYAFAMRIVKVPLNLISTSVGQVAYQKISALRNDNGDVQRFLTHLIAMLVIMSVPITLVFVFFGPQLFGFVFGEQWVEAGALTRIIAIWLVANFISSPLSTIPVVYGVPRFSFFYTLFFNIISTTVFYVCARQTGDFSVSLLITSIVSGMYLFFYIFQIVRLVKKPAA